MKGATVVGDVTEREPGLPIVNFAQVARTFDDRGSEAAVESLQDVDGGGADVAAFLGKALKDLEDEPGESDVLAAPRSRQAALLQSFLAEYADSTSQLQPLAAGEEVVFDEHDLGWVHALVPWLRAKLDIPKRLPRPQLSSDAVPLPAQANVGLLGDWGTGLYGAPPAARSIVRSGDYHALVHLGDVYYCGTAFEERKHFLDLWPRIPAAVNRACNSNHEMYSGGEGYFGETLIDFGQPSSTFLLENDHWVLAGLDTAYHDHDLDPLQLAWLDDVVRGLAGRRLVLFSHHQPFSQLGQQGPLLQAKLADLLGAGTVYAWYWGHEHLLAIYDRHATWGTYGRCVGHGGIPYFRHQFAKVGSEALPEGLVFRTLGPRGSGSLLVPGARILDGPNEYLGDKADRYGPNGYMRLEFNGGTLTEKVMAPNGVCLSKQDLA